MLELSPQPWESCEDIVSVPCPGIHTNFHLISKHVSEEHQSVCLMTLHIMPRSSIFFISACSLGQRCTEVNTFFAMDVSYSIKTVWKPLLQIINIVDLLSRFGRVISLFRLMTILIDCSVIGRRLCVVNVTNLNFVNCIDIFELQQFTRWQSQYCRSCYFDNIKLLAMVHVLVISSNA